MAFLPKPYNVGADIAHLEHVRSPGQAIGIALDKASSAEGGPKSPFATNPLHSPNILRRLSLKPEKVPTVKVKPSKFAKLRTPRV